MQEALCGLQTGSRGAVPFGSHGALKQVRCGPCSLSPKVAAKIEDRSQLEDRASTQTLEGIL
jgi:hypothetical protein